VPAAEPAFYFCQLIPRIGLLVFLLALVAIKDKNECKFKWLWDWAAVGQGIRPKT
jgi:hypothetical protein